MVNQSAGGVPFFLNSNDHFTSVSFMVQANSVGRAEGGNWGRNTKRPLPEGFRDHFRSFWIPSIVTCRKQKGMGETWMHWWAQNTAWLWWQTTTLGQGGKTAQKGNRSDLGKEGRVREGSPIPLQRATSPTGLTEALYLCGWSSYRGYKA